MINVNAVVCIHSLQPQFISAHYITTAMLSQGEPSDAADNFNAYYRILPRHHAVSLPQHGFLVYSSDRSNVEINYSTLIFTAVTLNHGDSRKSRHTTKITKKPR